MQRILDGETEFHSGVDFPICLYYKEVLAMYADCKVILNFREFEPWYKSASETIFYLGNREASFLSWIAISTLVPGFDGVNQLILGESGLFQGRVGDRQFAQQVHAAWAEEVRRHVPPEKLLEWHPKDGWAPLCKFLNVTVPDSEVGCLARAGGGGVRQEGVMASRYGQVGGKREEA